MHTLLNTNGHVVADPNIGRGMTFPYLCSNPTVAVVGSFGE